MSEENMIYAIKRNNKSLCNKYPFLTPTSYRLDDDEEGYVYTTLDGMELGWRNTFGMEMCNDISDKLRSEGIDERDYSIYYIGSCDGQMEIRDNMSDNNGIRDIINKYILLSNSVCIRCGSEATKRNEDNLPVCDNCERGGS